jgi:osmotically-inducible protein OsmY
MTTATMIRTDQEIQADVLTELRWDQRVQANEIGVAVKEGVVTLTGKVDTFLKKWRAEEAAHRVNGVVAVANDIEVRTIGEWTDTDIAAAAVNALKWNASIPAEKIHVTVSNGWVTLKGDVEWQYQRPRGRAFSPTALGCQRSQQPRCGQTARVPLRSEEADRGCAGSYCRG